MSQQIYRKSDPHDVFYSKSPRIVNSELGFFYRVRGGKLNGPFKSRDDAESDLSTFIKISMIEAELDPENHLRTFNRNRLG